MRTIDHGRLLAKIGAIVGLAVCSPANAQLRVLSAEVPLLFGGGKTQVPVVFENPGADSIEVNLLLRMDQATSATLVPTGEPRAWKKLMIPAHQKIIESTPVELPDVRAETRFIARWLAEDGKTIGSQQLRVYPRTLLKELGAIGGEKPLGVFDPENQLKPVLRKAEVEFTDLEDRGLEYFDGALAVAGPFSSTERMPSTLGETIMRKVQGGTRVIWIRPPREPRLEPRTRFIAQGTGVMAMTDSGLCGNFDESPRAQLNLVRLARLISRPELLTSIDIKP